MDRAVALLEVRAVDDAQRTFEGIANSATIDSYETIIEPAGASFRLPLPLFFHSAGKHDHSKPIGSIVATEIRNGMRWVRAHVPTIADDGTPGTRAVKDRVDAAWADIKNRLVRGLSIDFIPLEPKNPRAGSRITRWNWLGLTVTPLPSNTDATILSVRSAFAASGDPAATPPGVSGPPRQPNPRPKMTTQEQITQHENSRAAKVARQVALMERSGAEGSTLGETEAEEYDTLTREVEAIDGHLARLNSLKNAVAARAVPIVAPSAAAASQSRSGVPVVSVRSRELPGTGFARYVMAFAAAKGNRYEAAEYARQVFGETQGGEIAEWHRAASMQTRTAVAAGNTTDANWAAPLVQTNYVNEFLDLLRPQTLLGKIQGLRRVPYDTSIPAVTGGTTFKWVGQGKGKPVTKAQFSAVTLGHATAAGISVLTKQLIRLSTPDAQATVRDILVSDCRQFLDTQFVDSSVAAVTNVNPASITNGVTGTAASGTDVADARTDISARIQAFAAASYGLGGLVILMSESQAFALGSMINSVGQPAYPGLGINGGSILGVPVVTSESVGAQIIFAHAPSILIADADGIEIDMSTEASVEMNDTPSDPADASTVYTSLWQNNLVGIRVERMITWGKARSTAVDRITSAAYAA